MKRFLIGWILLISLCMCLGPALFGFKVEDVPPLPQTESVLGAYRLPIALAFFLFVTVYYALAWYFVGRDPARQTAIPQWQSRQGIEPGLAIFIRDQGYSQMCLVANIVELAVRGYLTMEEREGGGGPLWLMPTARSVGEHAKQETAVLPKPMRRLVHGLFSRVGEDGILVGADSRLLLYNVNRRLAQDYEESSDDYFRRNTAYSLIAGFILFFPMIVMALFLEVPQLIAAFDAGRGGRGLAGPFIALGVQLLFVLLIDVATRFIPERIMKHTRNVVWAHAAMVSLLMLCIAATLLWIGSSLMGGVVAAAVPAYLFSKIMPIRTQYGAQLSADVEGLAMYMETAERYRLASLGPLDEMTAQDRSMMPYATFDWKAYRVRLIMKLIEGIESALQAYDEARNASSFVSLGDEEERDCGWIDRMNSFLKNMR